MTDIDARYEADVDLDPNLDDFAVFVERFGPNHPSVLRAVAKELHRRGLIEEVTPTALRDLDLSYDAYVSLLSEIVFPGQQEVYDWEANQSAVDASAYFAQRLLLLLGEMSTIVVALRRANVRLHPRHVATVLDTMEVLSEALAPLTVNPTNPISPESTADLGPQEGFTFAEKPDISTAPYDEVSSTFLHGYAWAQDLHEWFQSIVDETREVIQQHAERNYNLQQDGKSPEEISAILREEFPDLQPHDGPRH